MPEQYEVSVTIGVRQLNAGPASFSASDTFIVKVTGYAELMDVLVTVHDAGAQLRARAVTPQDTRRRGRD